MGDLACTIISVDDISAATDHPAAQFLEAGLQGIRSSRKRPTSELPVEIIESILSYLSVPALCRCRSVCKKWKELFRKEYFLNRWDHEGGKQEFLFVTRYLSTFVTDYNDLRSCVDDAHWRTTCFLDLHERRWNSYPTFASEPAPGNDHHVRLLAIHDGLVCELAWLGGVRRPLGERRLDIFDPVAKRRRWLPLSTSNYSRVWTGDDLPMIVTVVDNANRSFKIFLMKRTFDYEHTAGFFVYESSTNAWRRLVVPPETLDDRVRVLQGRRIGESAVFFQGNLYVAVRTLGPADSDTFILSYNLQENLWREVLVVGVISPAYPQLLVSGNRMFIAMWSIPPLAVARHSSFEIREILLNQNLTELVVNITDQELRRISSEAQPSIQYGFPLNSNSVLLLSRITGRLLTYDHTNGVGNGAAGALPPHPLLLSDQDVQALRGRRSIPHYRGRLSKLSLRNIL